MTLLTWIFFKIKKTLDGKPTTLGIRLIVILSAVAFGLAHLPLASSYVNISPLQLPKQLSQIEQCKIIKVRLTVSNQWQVTILLLSLLRLAA